MSVYEENRQTLIDAYLRASLFGYDRVKVDNFEYCLRKSVIIITRIFHYAKVEKIVVPDEFDVFNATLIRKSLKYLDLGNCVEAAISLRNAESLEIFIAKKLNVSRSCWTVILSDAKTLKYINLDSMLYIYSQYLEKSRNTLIEGSFKSAILIDINSFCDFSNLQIISLGRGLAEINKDAFKNCTKLKEIYFYGTQEDFAKVYIKEGNECFKRAKIHFIK